MAGEDGSKSGGEQTLLSLPQEIQDLIWDAVVEDFTAVPWEHGRIGRVGSMDSNGLIVWPALYVCRQVSRDFYRRLLEGIWVSITVSPARPGSRRQAVPQGVLDEVRQLKVTTDLKEEVYFPEAQQAVEGMKGLLSRFERLAHVLITVRIDAGNEIDEDMERETLGNLRSLALMLDWQGAQACIVTTSEGARMTELHWWDGKVFPEEVRRDHKGDRVCRCQGAGGPGSRRFTYVM